MSCAVSRSSHFVGQYWVRPGWNRAVRLFRPKRLKDRTAGDRFIAALLREDAPAVDRTLQDISNTNELNHLFEHLQTTTGQLVCLVFELTCRMKLLDRFAQVRSAEGETLAARLRLSAATGLTSHERSNAEFVALLD